MPSPSPQRYVSIGRRQGIDDAVLTNAVAAIRRIRNADARLTPVLTLRHLSALSGVPYFYLRHTVTRNLREQYKFVYLKKRVPGRSALRMICIPRKQLMQVQRWITQNILRFTIPHEASYAFHPDSKPIDAVEQHLNCDWLLKVDLEDFFHSITERDVCRIFSELGYSRLLSFEMARIVTIACDRGRPSSGNLTRWAAIPSYRCDAEGMLPQGAPTSPMLSNLAFHRADTRLAELAAANSMRYSRYADDLTFSSKVGEPDKAKSLSDMKKFKREVLTILNDAGFRPNLRKTVIRGPGTRRIVLGTLVDTDKPRLPIEFRDNLRLHLYFLKSPKHGPAAHARSRKTSISGLFHHVRGLISWAECVEPDYGAILLNQFRAVKWPPMQPRFTIPDDWDSE